MGARRGTSGGPPEESPASERTTRETGMRAGEVLNLRLQQRYEREEAEEHWGGAGDGFVTPLALRLHAQMGTGFFQGHLHLPALDEPGDDLQRRRLLVGAPRRHRAPPHGAL